MKRLAATLVLILLLCRAGAISGARMTHIALQEQLDGKAVDWMEKFSDEQDGRR